MSSGAGGPGGDARGDILMVSHRMPWPLDRGERIRGWNVVNRLARNWRVHLGCVCADASELRHVPRLLSVCETVGAFHAPRRAQAARALAMLRPGRPMMPDFYHSPALARWVRATASRTRMDAAYVFSVAMSPYLAGLSFPRVVLDAQDVDSEKWAEYAAASDFPRGLFWAREARTLLRYERACAAAADVTLFVSAPEAARFAALAPESASKVMAMECGVDLDRFSPHARVTSPYEGRAPHVAFVGNMDYWPNADAACWYARSIHPMVRAALPGAEFWVVGANPSQAVRGLAALPGVRVTGRVDDVRPYVLHAGVVVCPLRMARGIQNKVLEAMAMGRPVVASPAAFEGVRAVPGRDLLVADGAAAFAAAVVGVADGRSPGLGRSARACMEAGYSWDHVLDGLESVVRGP